MSVTKEQVDHIAKLARLSFTDSEKAELISDLNDILSYVEQLNEVDTKNIEPLLSITEETNRFREDKEKDGLSIASSLQNAPDSQDRFFKVPKVISQE